MHEPSKLQIFLKLIRTVRNWPTVLLHRYGFLKGDLVVHKLRSGLIITSRSFAMDRSALQDVWLEESYEPSRAGVAWDWNACRTIVDIGGNIGTFTLYALSHAPSAIVHVVEPEPGNIGLIRRNVEQNGFQNRTHVHQFAVSRERGTATLNIGSNSGGHSLYRHKHLTSKVITVPTLPLSDFFREQQISACDFLKLDCEGGEYDALYDLPVPMLQRIRAIAVECHAFSDNPRHRADVLCNYLAGHGFRIVPLKKSIYLALRQE